MKLQTLVLSRVLFIIAAVAILVLLSSVNPRPVKSGEVLLKYDLTAERTITGVVEDVRVFQCPLSAGLGTHLALRTENGPLIAREITSRNRTFIFRRPNGKPLWEE